MKNTIKQLFYILLIITFLFGIDQKVYGQKKVNITTGIGIPELLNLGIYYQLDQYQMGLSVGTLPMGSGGNMISVSGDVYYHFGGYSELSDRRPWYGRLGLNYLRDENESFIDKYTYLNTRVGRDFNISEKIGIKIDAGAIFELSNERTRKRPPSGWNLDFDFDSSVIPSLGVGLFLSI